MQIISNVQSYQLAQEQRFLILSFIVIGVTPITRTITYDRVVDSINL